MDEKNGFPPEEEPIENGEGIDVYLPEPPVPEPQPQPMNRKIYSMTIVAAVMVFLLCMYCIGSDILQGATGGTVLPAIKVNIQTQPKPELNPLSDNVTEGGTYTVEGVAELVQPSIVEVYNYSGTYGEEDALVGTGSGIVVSEDGYILTNAHVVSSEAYGVLIDGEEDIRPATLVGSDAKTDLAVLKIEKTGLTPAVFGDSDEMHVGEDVVAIGNPAGLENTVTRGIVSAIGRQVRADSSAFRMECIQTDAAISPGNSGGALVNMYGQVIGITSAKYASDYSSASAYEGLGFAITANEALPILKDLVELGYVSGRFRIGIVFTSASSPSVAYDFEMQYDKPLPEGLRHGLMVSEISEDCDISQTILKPGDVITKIEGEPVEGYDDVLEVLDGYQGGDVVTAHCRRYRDNGSIDDFDIRFKLEEDTSGNY